MNKKYAAICAFAFGIFSMDAASPSVGYVKIDDFHISHSATELTVKIDLDASSLRMDGNREIVYTPMLVNGNDTACLPSFTIAGRNRFYRHIRNESGPDRMLFQAGKTNSPVSYTALVHFADWMNSANLVISTDMNGCCGDRQARSVTTIARLHLLPPVFMPEMAYVSPKAEAVKVRSIDARAFIDFPVNKTKIYPEYRRNPGELSKIRATIDSVRNDSNLSITGIRIKGFASPEGSYANNARLAEGRTEALSEYVKSLYDFNPSIFSTSYEPEDWQGLRDYVESAIGKESLSDSNAILSLIDSGDFSNDDLREAAMKKQFPADYKFLLANVYPALRHSDYTVVFNVRSYTSPDEIIAMMRRAPQNLSLQELYKAATSRQPGSEIFNEAFDIAVRMFPDDPVANLNAACAAIQRNDLKTAAAYLKKAGDSPEARYARAIISALQGDVDNAAALLGKLPELPQAQNAVAALKEIAGLREKPYTLTVNIIPSPEPEGTE